MLRRGNRRARRGYALVLVSVFLLLLLAMLGATFRQTAAMLRVETARSNQVIRDEGSLRAAARALAMLENGPPPADPYVVVLGVSTSAGPRSYQVTFASTTSATGGWSVQVVPAPGGP
jgi:hypothetical protein